MIPLNRLILSKTFLNVINRKKKSFESVENSATSSIIEGLAPASLCSASNFNHPLDHWEIVKHSDYLTECQVCPIFT